MESRTQPECTKIPKCILRNFEPLTALSYSSTQEISLLLRNPKVYYRAHRSPAENMAEVTAKLKPLNKAA
jgi:hypothetical protein